MRQHDDRGLAEFGLVHDGGDEEDRTLDLTDANRTLSQLSYAPKLWNLFNFWILLCASCQVARARFADHLLSQLSYAPR
jgi:hypothetical protein